MGADSKPAIPPVFGLWYNLFKINKIQENMHQKQKGFAPIIIIGIVVLGLAIVGGGGYYLINKNKQKENNNKIQGQVNVKIGEGYIYIDSIEKAKGTGILYYEKEYFRFNLKGEKVILLTIPDSGYVYGWNNPCDKNFKVKDLNEVKTCLLQDKELPCIADTKSINALISVEYTKEDHNLFSISKRAKFVFNEQNNIFELDAQSEISMDQINGLFKDDEALFLNNNKKEIYDLAMNGNEFQKKWSDELLKKDIKPYIKVVEPNENKSFCFGEEVFIEWESQKISSLRLMVRDYYLYGYTNYYFSGQPTDYPSTYNEEQKSGRGKVAWVVGDASSKMFPGETYKIAIEARDENGNMLNDESDNFFIITDCLDPSFTLIFPNTSDRKVIAETLFENYLKQFLAKSFSSQYRLTDYKIDNIEIIDSSNENCFSFNASYSVNPSQGNSYWFRNDGFNEGDGWVKNKHFAIDAIKKGNGWIIKEILGTTNYSHQCGT